MRGPPSVAWTTSDEGQRQCCLDNVSGNSLRSDERSPVASSKIATVERRRARLPVTRQAAPSKVPDQDVAPDRRSPPSLEGERREGGAPRLTTSGADEARLYP